MRGSDRKRDSLLFHFCRGGPVCARPRLIRFLGQTHGSVPRDSNQFSLLLGEQHRAKPSLGFLNERHQVSNLLRLEIRKSRQLF